MKHFSFLISCLCLVLHTSAQIITTVAGTGNFGYNGDGIPATSANMSGPTAVVADSHGNFYISSNLDCRIRKVSVDGIISTVAGTGVPGFSGDGGPATLASISQPEGLCIDKSGNLFICDSYNNRIRRIDTNGIITTIAGTGEGDFGGDGGPATSAKLWGPMSVYVDEGGNIYIADAGNKRIRKVDADGTITTIAGTGVSGYNGDGISANSAMIGFPRGVSKGKNGNIYFGDISNRRIRMIDRFGYISTVVGTGISGHEGDNGPATNAKILGPKDIVFDKYGNMFFVDGGTDRVKKVNTAGIITNVAGSDDIGFGGDGGPATAASLVQPGSIALMPNGDLLIADFGSKRVRMVTNVVGVNNMPEPAYDRVVVFPNPAYGHFEVRLSANIKEEVTIRIFDITGRCMFSKQYPGSDHFLVNAPLSPGYCSVQLLCTSGVNTITPLIIR